jgi:3-hydroxyisobutyrate dehydrogenase-like beta-hydroxyacid dehydrogenase
MAAIGFIGLGAMGCHMAASLQRAGHRLSVHDLNRETANEHVAAGARWADSAAGAAEGSQILFTSLPGPRDVEEVAATLHDVLKPDTAWFDLTTNSPDIVRKLHAKLAERGVHLLDAPVSGGPRGAQTGKLALWVGGEQAIYERHLPLLQAIGDQPLYVGPIGAGTIAKLVHNCTSFALQAVLAEVMTLGVKAGVDPLALFKAVRQGATGRARTFDRLPDFYFAGKFDPPAFALALAHKDMKLALELARKNGVPLRMGEAAFAELEEGMRRGWGGRDCRAAMTLQEERAGVSVRVPVEKLKGALD